MASRGCLRIELHIRVEVTLGYEVVLREAVLECETEKPRLEVRRQLGRASREDGLGRHRGGDWKVASGSRCSSNSEIDLTWCPGQGEGADGVRRRGVRAVASGRVREDGTVRARWSLKIGAFQHRGTR